MTLGELLTALQAPTGLPTDMKVCVQVTDPDGRTFFVEASDITVWPSNFPGYVVLSGDVRS
jgi:hypothetical protein